MDKKKQNKKKNKQKKKKKQTRICILFSYNCFADTL